MRRVPNFQQNEKAVRKTKDGRKKKAIKMEEKIKIKKVYKSNK